MIGYEHFGTRGPEIWIMLIFLVGLIGSFEFEQFYCHMGFFGLKFQIQSNICWSTQTLKLSLNENLVSFNFQY